MQLSLYRAERPERFEDIIGQKHIVRILQNQIMNNTVSQAYLFTGTHGTGKTSTARILAKALNCEGRGVTHGDGPIPCGECENCKAIKEGRFVDVIELDAASNNKVEDLRALIDLVKYPPTIGRYKVYIIDEVHMLTVQAENAFLKTLEEPPEYAIFILATTDPQKVKETIKSRCMQLNFKRVTEEDLADGMDRICKKSNVNVRRDALMTIASMANGSVRDALSLLEQCMAAGDSFIDKNLVLEYTGALGDEFFMELTDDVVCGKVGDAIVLINEAVSAGKDSRMILKDWLNHYRNLLVSKYVDKSEKLIHTTRESALRIRSQAEQIDSRDIDRAIRLLLEYINLARYSDRPRILVETVAIRLAGETVSGTDMSLVSNTSHRAIGSTRNIDTDTPTTTKPITFDQSSDLTSRWKASKTEQMEDRAEPGDVEPEDEPSVESSSIDPKAMWNNIASSMSRIDNSFDSLVASNSRADSFENGELLITVRKTKVCFAENVLDKLKEIARSLYGENINIAIRPGSVDSVSSVIKVDNVLPKDNDKSELNADIENTASSSSDDAKTDDSIIDSDIKIEEMVDDIKKVLNVNSVDIID